MTGNNRHERGFTLLISVILASVVLLVGIALADVAYKQVILASTARNSQVAFYHADSAMECALYYDQQFAAFNPGDSFDQSNMACLGTTVVGYTEAAYQSSGRRTTFSVACPNGEEGISALVTVYKAGTGTCEPGKHTCMYVSGFNTCNASDPNRFERGLKVLY